MKPYLTHDVDTVLELNNSLNVLRCCSNTVAEIAEKIELTLLKNKTLNYYKEDEEK